MIATNLAKLIFRAMPIISTMYLSLIHTSKIIFSLAQGIMKSVVGEIYLLISYSSESVTVRHIIVHNRAVMTYIITGWLTK